MYRGKQIGIQDSLCGVRKAVDERRVERRRWRSVGWTEWDEGRRRVTRREEERTSAYRRSCVSLS